MLSDSSRTSASDLTALNEVDQSSPKHQKPIFAEAGSIPLPDHGFHGLGLVFEDVTVYGAGKAEGSLRQVEDFQVALLKVTSLRLILTAIAHPNDPSTDVELSWVWQTPLQHQVWIQSSFDPRLLGCAAIGRDPSRPWSSRIWLFDSP